MTSVRWLSPQMGRQTRVPRGDYVSARVPPAYIRLASAFATCVALAHRVVYTQIQKGIISLFTLSLSSCSYLRDCGNGDWGPRRR